jgi:hypothetical protein
MQFVTLHESVTAGFATEDHHSPKVFRQLSEGIRSQLMQLHSILDQNVGKGLMRWHPKPRGEKLFKHNDLIIGWL